MKKEEIQKKNNKIEKYFLFIVITVSVVIFIICFLFIRAYYITTSAYEKMIVNIHENRNQVKDSLKGFHEKIITDKHKMSQMIRDDYRTGMLYVKYERFKKTSCVGRFFVSSISFSIDVIYDTDGNVVAIWPDYE